MTRLLRLLPFVALISSSAMAANPGERDYFVDHKEVPPGETLQVEYKFPASDYSIECHQDAPASKIASVEWEYEGVTYKGQIGEMRSVTLMSGPASTGLWMQQSAEPTGNLVFKNLDSSSELFVTCSYQVTGQEDRT